MKDDCERYSQEKHDEIEHRWQKVTRPRATASGACTAAEMWSWMADHFPMNPDLAWLDACLCAQDDVQILLEGIDTLKREHRATLDGYTDALRLSGEEILRLKAEKKLLRWTCDLEKGESDEAE